VIYLHGVGERGCDLSWVKRYGLPALLDKSVTSVNCPVICPQLEADAAWEPDRVASFIETSAGQHRQKVLIGYSLGGSGVCEVVSRHGPVVAVAIAISGQAPQCAQTNQSGVNFFAIQGELDPWPCTSSFVESINEMGGVAQSVTLVGKGHYISEEALFHPNLLALLHSAGIRFGGESISAG
jgi:predicted esterase